MSILFNTLFTIMTITITNYILINILLKRFDINPDTILDWEEYKLEFAVATAMIFYLILWINGLSMLIKKNHSFYDILKYIFSYLILLPSLFYLINKYILCGKIMGTNENSANIIKSRSILLTHEKIINTFLIFLFIILLNIVNNIFKSYNNKQTNIFKTILYCILYLPIIGYIGYQYYNKKEELNNLNLFNKLQQILKTNNILLYILYYVIIILLLTIIINSIYKIYLDNTKNIIYNIFQIIIPLIIFCIPFISPFISPYIMPFISKYISDNITLELKDQILLLFLTGIISLLYLMFFFLKKRNINSSIYITPIILTIFYIIFRLNFYKKNSDWKVYIPLIVVFCIFNLILYNIIYKSNILDTEDIV